MAIFKRLIVGLLVAINLSTALSTEVHITGPTDAVTGDYEKFTCEFQGEDVTSNYGFEWKFKLKNGDVISMNDSDILTALEVRNFSQGHLTVSSFLRMDSADIASVVCEHSPKISESLEIHVKDLAALTADNEPCEKAERTGKPVTSLYMPSTDLLSPAYRKSHYISDQFVSLTYGVDVTEFKLTCYSPSHMDPPVWSINKEMASKMKYAAWARQSIRQSCKQQVLHIYQVAGEPGKITNLTLDCAAGGSSSKVNLGFEFTPARSGIDLNSTESCINEVVEQFYNKELTGVGVGSSLVIILMMAGIAVLKRQLNQQQNINRNLQSNSGGNNGNGGSANDNMNPNHNNYNSINNVSSP